MISHLSDEEVRQYAKSFGIAFGDKGHVRTAPIQDLRRVIDGHHAQTQTPLPEWLQKSKAKTPTPLPECLQKTTSPFLDWWLESGVYYTVYSSVAIFATIKIIDFVKLYYGVFVGILKDISIICIMVGVIMVWFNSTAHANHGSDVSSSTDGGVPPTPYKKKAIPATLKRLVWNANVGEAVGKTKCLCCRVTDITQLSFHCGHVVAESRGGETVLSNLKPICQNCNSSMGSTNMETFMQKMI